MLTFGRIWIRILKLFVWNHQMFKYNKYKNVKTLSVFCDNNQTKAALNKASKGGKGFICKNIWIIKYSNIVDQLSKYPNIFVGKNFIIRIRISSILLKIFEYIRIFVTHCVCWLLSQMGNLIFRNQNILRHILFSQKEFCYGF